MKKNLRFMFFLVASLFLVSFIACSSDEDSSSSGGNNGASAQNGNVKQIEATADNIVNILENLTESSSIKVTGELTDELLSEIGDKLHTDKSSKVYVYLDLSEIISIEKISEKQFYETNSLKSIILPNTITEIGDSAFSCSSIESITLPNAITKIPLEMFSECKQLKSITLPDNVEIIEDYAFEYCSSLESITIPSNVTKISSGTFINCESLESVELPDNLTKIENGAFRNCIALKTIELPDNLKEIEIAAFGDCIALKSVEIPKNINDIGEGAFVGCTSLEKITVLDNNSNYSSIDGVLYENGEKTLHTWPAGKSNATIRNSVQKVGAHAFDSSSLESIEIPSTVTKIESGAFFQCSNLKTITIPANVLSLGNCIFGDCTALEVIKFEKQDNWYWGYTSEQFIKDVQSGDLTNVSNYITDTGMFYSRYLNRKVTK